MQTWEVSLNFFHRMSVSLPPLYTRVNPVVDPHQTCLTLNAHQIAHWLWECFFGGVSSSAWDNDFVTCSSLPSSPASSTWLSSLADTLSLQLPNERRLVFARVWWEGAVMRHPSPSAITTPRTSKLLGLVSIKTAAHRDTPGLIHNKTQLLATAAGPDAIAACRQTSRWITAALNSYSCLLFLTQHYFQSNNIILKALMTLKVMKDTNRPRD